MSQSPKHQKYEMLGIKVFLRGIVLNQCQRETEKKKKPNSLF